MTHVVSDLAARSKWSVLKDIEVAEVSPASHPIQAELVVPGSKSLTNRALIMAALAHGESELSGILKSDDSYWCIQTLKELGVEVKITGDTAKVYGMGGNWPVKQAEVYIGAAGTTARFLPGALAAAKGGNWVIRASKRMSERPMHPLITALQQLGASIRYLEKEGYLPIEIRGEGLKGGEVHISGSTSSQFISGLLIASALAENPVTICITDHIVQHAYVKMTIDLLEQFGIHVDHDDSLTMMRVKPQSYHARRLQLEADASTAGYFFALAALTNGRVRITNLSYQTRQPDIQLVDVFERMGCRVTRGNGFIELEGVQQLKGGFDISMKEMSDQTLTLAAVAPFADGPIAIHDVAHIRHHECDRISAIVQLLTQMGIRVEERKDGLTVYPGQPKAAELFAYDDHRVAMSLALIGAKVPGIRILDPGCVSKTCPQYFNELEKLGLQVKLEKKATS
ncbi:3-phosphoshikimate 1-carboxyvinyltransferase [Thermoflavimicrobium dichotomicum]|uniref:3-phosphoshikimate 1-carboxyvinyltransferase n=1 Tax=Thermoflavimicrobium dichotomicum TaxID=46223 RepID=A0A1I3JU63_9BACL|nr:3-phosphoshikimate 1-carboxyvinyltransferase [Thermoflavimicrobium dichotomicum]SFI63630.1 3-phosphoshikimate 1-carboxyvinyltransferase [Thermoflavimicrobium dichotomicum]